MNDLLHLPFFILREGLYIIDKYQKLSDFNNKKRKVCNKKQDVY